LGEDRPEDRLSVAFDADLVAAETLAALDAAGQMELPSKRYPSLSGEDAYAVTAALRRLRTARGERQVGRKIGFTNRNIWPEYNVYAPIWGDMYDTTVRDVAPGEAVVVSHLPEPRIEPEIVLGIEGDIRVGMDPEAAFASIGWIAHGFEIVQSVFPGWKFTWVDSVIDNGLHGGLALGPRRMIRDDERRDLFKALSTCTLTLSRDGVEIDRGLGSSALDGPVQALMHLVDVLARDHVNPPLRRGELITTGTLTRAFPVVPGETWSTSIAGIDMPGLSVRLT
jgi:2-keto-4-pentenoate hydratase